MTCTEVKWRAERTQPFLFVYWKEKPKDDFVFPSEKGEKTQTEWFCLVVGLLDEDDWGVVPGNFKDKFWMVINLFIFGKKKTRKT